MVRVAGIQDAKVIHKLLMHYAKDGMMLSRSLSDIYEAIRDFFVFEEGGEVIGTVCLSICWEDLAEVRSLAVAEGRFGGGVGRKLVERCIEEAQRLGVTRVFALTYKAQFFEKLGFQQIEKSELPQKIWSDCIKCVKFPECDEIAVIREL
ncbi:MAG TPA: N-acetyltransferase [Desulfuromonadales bacterium]|nr:N-acetyltransferase [Desulfuromonadales bacterium]